MFVRVEHTTFDDCLYVPDVYRGGSCIVLVKRWNDQECTYNYTE